MLSALNSIRNEVIKLDSDQPLVLIDALRLVVNLMGREAQIQYRPSHPADLLVT